MVLSIHSVSHDPFLSASKMKKKSSSVPDSFWTVSEGHWSLAKLNSEDGAGLGSQVNAKSIEPAACASEWQDSKHLRPVSRKSGIISVS